MCMLPSEHYKKVLTKLGMLCQLEVEKERGRQAAQLWPIRTVPFNGYVRGWALWCGLLGQQPPPVTEQVKETLVPSVALSPLPPQLCEVEGNCSRPQVLDSSVKDRAFEPELYLGIKDCTSLYQRRSWREHKSQWKTMSGVWLQLAPCLLTGS